MNGTCRPFVKGHSRGHAETGVRSRRPMRSRTPDMGKGGFHGGAGESERTGA